MIYADSSITFDGKTFSELAMAGDKGVIVALIIAYIALILVFAGLYAFSRWCEMRRYERKEIDRDRELIRLRIEENKGRERLVKAQTELAASVRELTGMAIGAASDLKEIGEKVDRLAACWKV